MRNKIILVALLLFGFTSLAFAQTESAETPANDRENKPVIADDKPGKAMVKNMMHNQVIRAEKNYSRLKEIKTEIESEITSLREGGASTAQLQRLVTRADLQEEKIDMLLSDMGAYTNNIENARSVKGTVKVFIQKTRELKKQLITYHKSLTDAVAELKELESSEPEENN